MEHFYVESCPLIIIASPRPHILHLFRVRGKFFVKLHLHDTFIGLIISNKGQKCIHLQNNLRFPEDEMEVSDDAKDLILSLIAVPERRLGEGGISDFQQHPFFAGIEWDTIREGATSTPNESITF